MKKIIFRLFAGILLLGISSTYAQSIPFGWTEIQPFENEKQQICRRNSDLSWTASAENQDLIIQNAKPNGVKIPAVLATHIEKLKLSSENRKPNPLNSQFASALLELPSGWVVGFDLGEWGGSLWWFDLQGNSTKLSEQNTHQIIQTNNQIYAATGLAHLGIDRGALIVLSLDVAGVPQITNTIQTPSTLEAISLWRTKIIGASFLGPVIISENGVVQYDGTSDTRRRHINYPQSISVDSAGSVYIAGRYGVAKYSNFPTDFEPIWLVPETCVQFDTSNSDYGRCLCIE